MPGPVLALLALLASTGLARDVDSRPGWKAKAKHRSKAGPTLEGEGEAQIESNAETTRSSKSSGKKARSGALQSTVDQIDKGVLEDTFFAGERLFQDEPEDEREEVGGCILDKVIAIVSEGAHREHLNELKQDTAACCTRGNRISCTMDLEEGFDILAGIPAKCAHEWHFLKHCYDNHASKAASSLLGAVQKRVMPGHLSPKAAFFVARCGSQPGKCMKRDIGEAVSPERPPPQQEEEPKELEDPAASLLAMGAGVETTTLVLR